MTETRDLRIERVEPLPAPDVIARELPAPDAVTESVAQSRAAVREIVAGRDPRWLAIVGPCSIHDPVGRARVRGAARGVWRNASNRSSCVVMRVYFEKPRTTVGWKGLINDPHLDGTYDVAVGPAAWRAGCCSRSRELRPAGRHRVPRPDHAAVHRRPGSWAAIGARTTESQTHREMASGLSMPVGFKNGTDGSALVAVHAMQSARAPHTFLGIDRRGATAVIHTRGNPDAHLVLRGGKVPNYDPTSIRACEQLLEGAGLPARILVDCSHAQTEKDYRRQPAVLADLVAQRAAGNRSLMGFMLESNLHAGRQDLGSDLAYGVSITDGCIDWDTTERCLLEAGSGRN